MTEPTAPLPPDDIPLSEPTISPPMGAVPGATPMPPPTMEYGSGPGADPAGGGGGIMAPPGPYLGPSPDKDSKTMALLAHLLGSFTGFLGPLIIWLLKKDTSPFVDDQAKEALNFQLTILIGYVICGFLTHMCIGFILFPILFLVNLFLAIIATTKANSGIAYRYPFAIRVIK
jgi:uncharacterized Tic20 family protein